MATNPRSTVSERIGPALVSPRRRGTQRNSSSLKSRLLSTLVALVVLALVLRYLPPGPRNAHANDGSAVMQVDPAELHFSELQIAQAPGGSALYLDGSVVNTGMTAVTGATAEVEFRDAQGTVIASVQEPLVGMARSETSLIGNEFAGNPIAPNEKRLFRVAVEQVPPAWNHEVPTLKIVAAKGP